MDPAILTLIILACAAVSFFTEIIPLPVTALLVPIALSLFGLMPAEQAFSYFGNQWVVIFMAMFIVGEAAFQTGLADRIGRLTVKRAGHSEIKLLILIMAVVGLMSAFLSNTGTTAVFIPIVMGICHSAGIKPGKIFIPMAFATSLGGIMTLVGTPPNGIVNSVLDESGLAVFGFFEFMKIGAVLFVIGISYYALIGHRYLPETDAEAAPCSESMTYRAKRMWIALAILVFVIVMMASKLLPLVTAAVLGACLVMITRCVTVKEAFNSISWTTIFLFAGMLPMSAAMETSGAAKLLADMVASSVDSPYLLLAFTYLLTALITNFMSNTATSALMAPIGIAIAGSFGVSPMPIVMGIAVAASACFLTPVATPPNTIVLAAGGYHFRDYFKAGWPLQLISAAVSIALIPLIWPF